MESFLIDGEKDDVGMRNTRSGVSGDKIWVFGEIGVVTDRERKREQEEKREKGRV